MSKKIVVVILILVLVSGFSIFINYFNKTVNTEGFDTYLDNIQDRGNPLAAATNPIKNPIVPIGISESEADKLRQLSKVALNNPQPIALSNGGTRYVESKTLLTPRIDTDSDFLGTVKFCKEKGQAENPFEDPRFVQDCGMCMSSGSLITGETFTKPTGVVVYNADKFNAYLKKNLNGQDFPRVIPSMNAAICKGASVSDDASPVLAITANDYDLLKRRLKCQHGGKVGGGCAICMSNNKFSYIGPNDPFAPLRIVLFGNGKASVTLGNNRLLQGQELSETNPTAIDLGSVKEGTPFTITIEQSQSLNGPFVFGALLSETSKEAPYVLSLNRIVLKDAMTGSTPKTGIARRFPGLPVFLTRINAGANKKTIDLRGTIPLTFVQKGVLASYDCKTAPYVSEQASADLLANGPCFKPKGQVPGRFSRECLQNTVLQASAIVDGREVSPTPEGRWYKNPQQYAGNRSLAEFLDWMNSQIPKVYTDIQTSLDVLGKDISTPCDSFLKSRQSPDTKCLVYLYKNTGDKNKRIGRTYSGNPSFTSLEGNTPRFCRPEGKLNPETASGQAELLQKAQGYKGLFGVDAIKLFLSDTFSRAISNLDATVPEAQGGKKEAWEKCFGLPIAPASSSGKLDVKKNAQGGTFEQNNCTSGFPSSFTPRQNTVLLSNFSMPANYRISFTLLLTSQIGSWTNIFHFSRRDNSSQFGDRSPAIFVIPNSTSLHVRIGDTRDLNWGFDTNRLPLNQQIPIVLTCQGSSVTMTIGTVQTISVTQPSSRYSGNVRVWGSDPWYPATPSQVSNFCFTSF